MRNTAANRAKVEEHVIVQLTMDDDRGFRGCLLIVSHVETWGVKGWVVVPGSGSKPAFYGAAWDKFELTGGRAAFGPDGQRLIPPEPEGAHHP